MFVDPEFWRQLSVRIKERREDLIEGLIRGNSADSYRETVAELRALQWVSDEAAEVIQKMNSRNEEAQ